MSRSVSVSTPSRLHFGLLRFAEQPGPSYGGLGMMIDSPRCRIELRAAVHWQAKGPQAERALSVARRVLDDIEGHEKPNALEIHVLSAIPDHCGLGGGTQLALAMAAGIRALLQLPVAGATQLAALAGRGERSAVGTHGFIQGGLLWETGRLPGETLGRLAKRTAMPSSWRVVMATPRGERGLSGIPEREAFAQLPIVPELVVARLTQLAEQHILPAAECGDVNAFGEGVFEYGRLSGECFSAIQGGAYASREIAARVQSIRELGVRGVGQSSWGPTIFAVVGDDRDARRIMGELRERPQFAHHELRIVAPDNIGAVTTSSDDATPA